MVHITNTNHALGNFIVRDDTGSYDNEYNEALITQERSEALKAAGRELVGFVAKNSLNALKMAGRVTLDTIDELVTSV